MTMDTRPAFRETAAWTGEIIAAVRSDQLGLPTPCSEWTVRDLLGHMVAILGRLRAMGEGAEPFSVSSMLDDAATIGAAEWPKRYADAVTAWEEVWGEDEVLARPIQAPFGTFPGAMVLGGYIQEYLVHGWDLARATGQDSEAPAPLAQQALEMARQTSPADQRGPGIPFDAPVTPRAEAGPTEQLANWLGHAV